MTPHFTLPSTEIKQHKNGIKVDMVINGTDLTPTYNSIDLWRPGFDKEAKNTNWRKDSILNK